MNSSHWVNMGCCTQNSTHRKADPARNNARPGVQNAARQARTNPAGRSRTRPATHTAASASHTTAAPMGSTPPSPKPYSTTAPPASSGSGHKAAERRLAADSTAQAPPSKTSRARPASNDNIRCRLLSVCSFFAKKEPKKLPLKSHIHAILGKRMFSFRSLLAFCQENKKLIFATRSRVEKSKALCPLSFKKMRN